MKAAILHGIDLHSFIVTKGFLGQGINRQSIDGATVSTLDVLLMRSNLNYTVR